MSSSCFNSSSIVLILVVALRQIQVLVIVLIVVLVIILLLGLRLFSLLSIILLSIPPRHPPLPAITAPPPPAPIPPCPPPKPSTTTTTPVGVVVPRWLWVVSCGDGGRQRLVVMVAGGFLMFNDGAANRGVCRVRRASAHRRPSSAAAPPPTKGCAPQSWPSSLKFPKMSTRLWRSLRTRRALSWQTPGITNLCFFCNSA